MTESAHRVLVIDDNPWIHEDVRKVLTRHDEDRELVRLEREMFGGAPGDADRAAHLGFEIDAARQGRDGVEAARRARAEGRPYTIAFVDVRMPPGWDGIETVGSSYQVVIARNAISRTRVGIYLEHATHSSLISRNVITDVRTGINVEWFYDGIGSAELFHVYITNVPGDVAVGSLGRVVEGYEAKICDDDGREVPDGELGSLWIRGQSVGLGYFMRTDDTRASFRGAWFVSADKFHRDGEGRFWYGGRTDDLLKVGGRFLAPIEVENVLLTHPAVADAASFSLPDRRLGEEVAAAVVRRPGSAVTERDLRRFAASRLAPAKVPRRIWFVDTELELRPGILPGVTVDQNKSWTDPIVGTRLGVQLTDRLSLQALGDVGGFGAGSDLTWQAFAGIGYRFHPRWTFTAGYRALAVDFERGDFELDVIMHGPVLGLGFRF